MVLLLRMPKYFIWIILALQACTGAEPQDIARRWSVDRFVVDGIDRTQQLPSLPWGTAIEFATDGTFKTNSRENNTGTWKISRNGSTIFLYFQQDGVQYKQWKVTVSKQYLVLKATTQQIYLSQTDQMPTLPPVTINLANNLPGTWYFYHLKSDSTLMQYPQKKGNGRWMKIDKEGNYESGEGKTVTFRGRWLLNHDTLTFSDIDRPWKKSWKVSMDKEGALYFHTLPDDSVGWQEVSFVNETNLP